MRAKLPSFLKKGIDFFFKRDSRYCVPHKPKFEDPRDIFKTNSQYTFEKFELRDVMIWW